VTGGNPDGGSDVVATGREAHGGRFAPVHAGVALVERELERLGTRPPRPQGGLQIGYERVDVTAGIDM
jgi:hypothetical protein